MHRFALIKDLVVLALIGTVVWYAYKQFEHPIRQWLGLDRPPAVRLLPGQFACEAPKFCSQLKSCDEARYYARFCPALKMDHEYDDRTCEQRWCGAQ